MGMDSWAYTSSTTRFWGLLWWSTCSAWCAVPCALLMLLTCMLPPPSNTQDKNGLEMQPTTDG